MQTHFPRRRIVASLLLCVGASFGLHAQDILHGDVGVAVTSHPLYPGSDQRKQQALPVLRLELPTPYVYIGNRYGGAPLQIGATPLHTAHWVAGAGVAYQVAKPRNSADASDLQGIPDIDRTALGSAFVAWSYKRYTINLRSDSDLGSRQQGTTITLALRRHLAITPRFGLTMGPQLVWGNRQHMSTFFGIEQARSPGSTLPDYRPAAGFQQRSFNLDAHYRMPSHWIVGAGVSVGQMMGPAKDSPLVEKNTQLGVTAFAAYHF